MPPTQVKLDRTHAALSRLIQELRDDGDDGPSAGDYRHSYTFDLVSNRLSKTIDLGDDGVDDEVISYTCNARDQLLTETSTVTGQTTYAYDANGSIISVTTPSGTQNHRWDLRHRLAALDADGDGQFAGTGDVAFAYDHEGVRIARSQIGGQTVYYLQTLTNPTGYSQVLEEWTSPDGLAPATLDRSYLIGQDVIAQSDTTYRLTEQWQFTWNNGAENVPFTMGNWDGSRYEGTAVVGEQTYYATATRDLLDANTFHITIRLDDANGLEQYTATATFTDHSATPQEFGYVSSPLAGRQYLLYDGGGHTRALLDPTGQVLDGRIYAYDAYGNRIDPDQPAIAATNLLYRGEYFDALLAQYVLRARYYDPSSGRFWSFDAYEASSADPLGLHKYLYANANPVYYTDPSGNTSEAEELSVVSTLNNLLSFVSKVQKAYNRARNIYHAAQSISTLVGLATGGLNAIIEEVQAQVGKRGLRALFGRYANILTKEGLESAVSALLTNGPQIALEILAHPGKMAELTEAYEGPNPAFVIKMPTPPYSNPLALIPPIPIGLKLGGNRIPVYLSFQTANQRGRFIGLAIAGDCKTGRFDTRVAEMFHMDYVVHASNLGSQAQSAGNWAVWTSSDRKFEFQIPRG